MLFRRPAPKPEPKPRTPSDSEKKALMGAPPPPASVEAPTFLASPIVRRPTPPSGARAFDAILKPNPLSPSLLRR